MPLSNEQLVRGRRVKCILGYDTDPGNIHRHPVSSSELSIPRTGQIYTVREVPRYTNNSPGLLLLEIQNPAVNYPGWGMCEPCWSPERFESL